VTINVSVSLLNEEENVTVEIKVTIQELGFLQLKLIHFENFEQAHDHFKFIWRNRFRTIVKQLVEKTRRSNFSKVKLMKVPLLVSL
jgi:hypothetical protein